MLELEHSGKMTSKLLNSSKSKPKESKKNQQKQLIINHAVPRQCGAAGRGRGRVLRRLGAKLHRATEGCGAGHGQCAVVGDGPSAGWEATRKVLNVR